MKGVKNNKEVKEHENKNETEEEEGEIKEGIE